jgi:eukaryotic-like serine/threonine-protein kinase
MATPIPEKIGKYQLIEPLGLGGMGTVYKAFDPSLDRLVAIKMLVVGIAEDPTFQQRFYREAQATASMLHPNIVTIFDLASTRDIRT